MAARAEGLAPTRGNTWWKASERSAGKAQVCRTMCLCKPLLRELAELLPRCVRQAWFASGSVAQDAAKNQFATAFASGSACASHQASPGGPSSRARAAGSAVAPRWPRGGPAVVKGFILDQVSFWGAGCLGLATLGLATLGAPKQYENKQF